MIDVTESLSIGNENIAQNVELEIQVEKYFSISERCGRNHQNKFCLCPLKGQKAHGS